jgi:inosose dehydratase
VGRSYEQRVAGAPISWGVCEVPGWGLELPRERVLGEMAEVGLRATELGAIGYLPEEPGPLRELLDRHGLRLVAGFVPVVLHDPALRVSSLAEAAATAARLRDGGAELFVSTVVVDPEWSPPVELDSTAWHELLRGLGELSRIVEEEGLVHVLHPHVGTLVEQEADVTRVLEESDVDFCLDSGHLVVGGVDPVRFASEAGARVRHAHLKDVDADVAARLNSEGLSLLEAVQEGLFTPLGEGVARVDETVAALEASGYDGWYVLEQDVALIGAEPPVGSGPVLDVRRNVEHLRRLLQAANGW